MFICVTVKLFRGIFGKRLAADREFFSRRFTDVGFAFLHRLVFLFNARIQCQCRRCQHLLLLFEVVLLLMLSIKQTVDLECLEFQAMFIQY